MQDGHTPPVNTTEGKHCNRRWFLKSAGVLGAASSLGGVATHPVRAGHVSGWPSTDDPYYSTLIDDVTAENLPPGTFVYGNTEADTTAAYSIESDIAEPSSLDVRDEDVPFSEAVRVDITEDPENPWDVTYIAPEPETGIGQGDVLLGVVYLRGPESSEAEPTAQYVAKGDEHLSTNMVTTQSQVRPSAEWTRYYFPIQFSEYPADAGNWRTEFFLGFGQQTIDIGGLALLYFAEDTSPDQLPSGPANSGPAGGWEAAADQRIQDHRTADLTVKVTDIHGDPVADADVEVEMQEHEFGFGCVLSADHLVRNTVEGDPYRENLTRLFNSVWFGNHHKWRFWEEEEAIADRATQWAVNNGFDIRGHVCLWANVSAWAIPPDVVKAMGVTWEDNGVTEPELDPDYVKQRSLDHIEAIIEDYGDHIDEWEIVNEVSHEPGLVRAVNGVPADQAMEGNPVEAPILAEWFDTAREVAPDDVTLAINDYNVLGGPYFSTRDDYERQIEFLTGNSSLDSVGMQCHLNQSQALGPQQVLDGLDRYAEHDVRLRITEFDMADDNWPESDKADFFHDFLKAVFSHHAVDDFLVAGMLSSRHWRGDAPFYGQTWDERKPSLDVYENLVFEEWWTEEAGTTSADGSFSTSGFKGDYDITASDGDVTRTVRATLSDGGRTVEVVLDPDATPEPEPEPVELAIDDTTVTTPDGGVGGDQNTDGRDESPTSTTAGQDDPADEPMETATDGQPGLGILSGIAGVTGLLGLRRHLTDTDDSEEDQT